MGLPAFGSKLLDSLRSIPARHGLGVARTGVEDHPPEPPGLGAVAALLGKDGGVAQGEVAVDALVDTAELVGSLPLLATSPTFTGHWPLATVLGPFGQLGIEDLAIPLELAFPQRRVGVAGVLVCDLGPTDRDITRRKAGKIRSCTICLQRTSSHTEYPIAFRLPSMTQDHRR